MIISPISSFNFRGSAQKQMRKDISALKAQSQNKNKNAKRVHIDLGDICIFDKYRDYIIKPDGKIEIRTNEGNEKQTHRSDKFKKLYANVLKEYIDNGSIEAEKADLITKQIDGIIDNL